MNIHIFDAKCIVAIVNTIYMLMIQTIISCKTPDKKMHMNEMPVNF